MTSESRISPRHGLFLVVGLVQAVGFAGTVAACDPAQPTTSPVPSFAESASAASSVAPATASASASSVTGTVESPPSLPAGVSVDPGLLEVLPTQIDGVSLEPDSTTAAAIASDALLAESALSIAVALAVAPGPSDSEDLAVASVIRLRPDVFDDAFFQEWRDTYDEAACKVADGVESEIQTDIDGRTAYIATCAGGAQTYHTYLEDQGFIVSITSAGGRHFGELILAGLAG